MPDKSYEELKNENYVNERLEKEREKSDDRYAKILAERVLWALLSVAFLALAGYYFKQFIVNSEEGADNNIPVTITQ